MQSSSLRFKELWKYSALLASAALFTGPAAFGQEAQKCFLWKVKSKTNTIYVLGSLHVASADFFPLPKEIEGAFAGSKSLAVEYDTEKHDAKKLEELIDTKGFYPDGESLSKKVSKKTMDALTQFCGKNKLKVKTMEGTRPWVVWMTMSPLLQPGPQGWNAEAGMDRYFLKKAAAQKKPILELETVESHMGLLAGLSPELQEALLAKALADGLGGIKSPLEEMGKAWIKGDVKAMEKLVMGDDLKRHPEYKGVLEKLFDERNVKMVEKIEGYLKSNETVFVLVGAGHLVGPKGIVKLLEERKYEVSQLTRAPAVKKAPGENKGKQRGSAFIQTSVKRE